MDLKRYRVHYHDTHAKEIAFTMIIRGYDREHVENKFYESEDSDGWTISKVEEVRQ